MTDHPSLGDIQSAADRIAGVANRTPLRRSEALSDLTGSPVWLKLETEQPIGAFKVRGAANALLQLDDDERAAGVVAVSSGNHGRAVAYVAQGLGVAATVCVSERVPAVKVDAIRALGADVIVAGPDQDDADEQARRLVDRGGMTFIHPFDDPRVIAGQGTIGLEILSELEPEAVLVPLSGGGLAGGIAVAVKSLSPAARMIGISQDRGPAMVRTLEAGRLVDVVEEDTLADALAGGLGPENHHSVELCSRYLDDTVLVSEDEIADAIAFLHRSERIDVEGGGAVGVAALLAGRIEVTGPAAVVISGGNIAPETLERVLAR